MSTLKKETLVIGGCIVLIILLVLIGTDVQAQQKSIVMTKESTDAVMDAQTPREVPVTRTEQRRTTMGGVTKVILKAERLI